MEPTFAERLAARPGPGQSLVGALAASRFVPILIDPRFGGDEIVGFEPAVREGLSHLRERPLEFGERALSSEVAAAVSGWLDGWDEEPYGPEYWPFQAAVVIDYFAQTQSHAEPAVVVSRMRVYCLEFTGFLDDLLDAGGSWQEDAERVFWDALLEDESSERYLLLAREDERRLLAAVERARSRHPH